MKTITFITAILLISILSFGQNPSMTISHSGLSPSSTLTVFAGEEIDFIYGGGGSHPMTEGWQSGESSSPIEFVTQTVTSAIPMVTFTLEEGTYYFHCGTNPGNSNNWGMITVIPNSSTGVNDAKIAKYKIYPNPSADILTIEGLIGFAEIFSLNGKKVMDFNTEIIDISNLSKGTYIVKVGDWKSTFIKN